MNISFNWLQEYFKAETSIDEVLEVLTQTGLEVEGCDTIGPDERGLNGLVVGEVKFKEKHPDADRLSLTQVDIGGEELLDIVCGAPNVEVGQKVVVAKVGSTLYPSGGEPFKITKSKIRGAESHGMICAEDEIGLGTSHDGIMVLNPEAPVGSPIKDHINIERDYQIEIGLTPNRTDAMSHMGVARDLVAGLLRKKEAIVDLPGTEDFVIDNESLPITISVLDTEACPRYAGLTMTGIKVDESPEWLQKRLTAIGLQPLNNVVDVTNFILHDCGQPLHAFDFDKIGGSEIVVRKAEEGTSFVTLDEVERKLSKDDLMICDSGKEMCIAGVFGGIDSGVSESTTQIFLESAFFDQVSVRKTAKRHALNTDASFRFERGVDPEMTIYALKRAAQLLKEICGAQVSSQIYDIYPNPIGKHTVSFSLTGCNRLIGKDIPASDVEAILTSLDIEVLEKNESDWELAVPAYRHDVRRHVDVCEEVLRIYGYNEIELPASFHSSLSHAAEVDKDQIQHRVSNLLVSGGFTEIMANSLISSDDSDVKGLEEYGTDHHVEILNPLSKELNVLRTSLVFGGLRAVAYNQNRQRRDLRFFEFGKEYRKEAEGFNEVSRLTMFLTGRKERESWRDSKGGDVNFFDLKGTVDALLRKLGLKYSTDDSENSVLAYGVGYKVGKDTLAEVGMVNPALTSKFGIDNEVFFAEVNWDLATTQYGRKSIKFSAVPKFPEVRRDLSLLVDETVSFQDIAKRTKAQETNLLKDINLFDVYEGDKLPAGKKSYAISIILQNKEKTLEDKQIDVIMNKIQAALEKDLGASLR